MIARRRPRFARRVFASAAAFAIGTFSVSGAAPATHIRRIVTLAPTLTEDVFAVGAGAMLVGVDAYSNRPVAAKKIERVGAFTEVDTERIVALHPDIVLGVSSQEPELIDVQRAGVATKTIDVDSLADDFHAIETIGALVGREPQAVAKVNAIRKRLDAARRRAAKDPPLRALVLIDSNPIYVAGGSSYLADLLTIAHLTNIAGTLHQAWPRYSAETLLAAQPDVIIMSTTAVLPPGSPWNQLSAIRRNRIIRIDDDLLVRPGPEVADLADTLIRDRERMSR